MNFVDFVFNCYTNTTSHVSQAFASCTHYTSYSLLNILHVSVCVFGLTNQVCKYFEFLCKTILMLENLNFGKAGFKTLFLKNITSHTHAFCSSISMLWGVSTMCLCSFQKLCFFFFFSKILWASVCVNWSKLIFVQFKLFWNCFKIFKEVSFYFDQSKLIFNQSKIVNQVF